MRKLFYIANIRFPTERAHGIQVSHMCSAFARQGAEVTLLVPDRETIAEDPYAYYGVERNFVIEKIPVPDIVQFGTAGFFVESFIFAFRAARRIRSERGAVIYTREEFPFLFLPRGRAFYEEHQLRRSLFFTWLIRRAKGIVAITQGLKNALVSVGLPAEKILVAHDGYDDKVFVSVSYRTDIRHRLGFSDDERVALYIGGLEAWKGPQTLCEAASVLAGDGIVVAVIGGATEELKKYKARYPLVNFLGPRPYNALPLLQQAADVLVVPNSATTELGSRFTSPLKLFAHMASGIPLVVSDVPAIREVLTDSEAGFFSPDDPYDLARAIRSALSGNHKERPEAALRMSLRYTWDKRAERVLAYIESYLHHRESL